MTVPKATMLGLLANKGERIVMGELGELLGMSPRNVTVLVDGHEKEQLVRCVPHERDRRAIYIEITEKGKGVAAAILAPHKKAIAGLYDSLTAKERQELAGLLSKLLATLRSLPNIS
jgi:DNA-binding MarR family transcriptional regulator